MNNKRAQAVLITLLVILLILIIAALFIIFFQPGFTFLSVSENADSNANVNNQITCSSPYIKVGIECCLDLNYNSVCDKDENYRITICSPPYIEKNGACCPDMNSNRICDNEEMIYDFMYDSRYDSRDYDRDRDSRDDYEITGASIDSPFDITDAELDRDSVEIELENEGDEDYMIEGIDIFRCGDERINRVLEEGKRKTFNIDCDDDLTRDSDLEVRYSELDDNETLIADGEIEVERR